ncbi:serine/threonine-protein kinase Sgk1-like [Coccinella septempunctata]|uniref:serine/threonine-protein kinase Sgk1-like n=1 Tax=Coccinella septempunctata TaxID=41139 RepID=UPI001D084645|nr:serine/threonine-protein kinase Sgk1-like [Coccinella septempunctata]
MFQMEHLHLGEILGKGSFGRVYRGQRHGQAVAVKRTMLTHQAIQEVDILRSLEHPNILSLQEAIIEADYLFMVMPLCDEDLNTFLRREGPRNQPSRFFRVMRQLAAAVTECHRRQIVHRDIKPANILRRRCRFLLADFGLVETLTTAQPLLTEPAGTMVYWAPEQRRLEPYDTSVDLWALGLVAVEVATGIPCRQGEEEQHWASSLDEKYRAEMERLRFPVRWFIEGLLQDNPSHRRPAAHPATPTDSGVHTEASTASTSCSVNATTPTVTCPTGTASTREDTGFTITASIQDPGSTESPLPLDGCNMSDSDFLERLDEFLGFVDPFKDQEPESPPRPVPLPLGGLKAFGRPKPNTSTAVTDRSPSPSRKQEPQQAAVRTQRQSAIEIDIPAEKRNTCKQDKRYFINTEKISKQTNSHQPDNRQHEIHRHNIRPAQVTTKKDLPARVRTVGTMGPNVYLELRPDMCWRCGQGEHSRTHCTGNSILFCSSCGLLGTLTRNCPCHSHHRQREAAVQCDIPSASTQSEPPRKKLNRFRMPASRELALRACPRCRELREAKDNSKEKSHKSEARRKPILN